MRNQRNIGISWALIVLVVVGGGPNTSSIRVNASLSSPAFSPQRIKNWIQKKCGNEGSAVWVYEGALYDPLDGHKICNVEGLELVRQVSEMSNNDNPASNHNHDKRRVKDLKGNHIKGDYSTTLLSRKLFCYQSPQEPRRLLDSIRLRPNAPQRKIPIHQAVAVYDSATTYVSRNEGKELVLHTEWPNGKCTWGFASSQNKPDDKSMDLVVFAKPRTNENVPDITTPTTSSNNGSSNVVVSPKRSQLIQFGASSQQGDNQGKFGARETYSYTMESSLYKHNPASNWWNRLFRRNHHDTTSSSCTCKYTRYGEGPPWYGPGKYCMLELQGRKVTSVQDAPPLAASVAAERVPGFMSVDTPIVSDASAQRAVEWFRRGNLQLTEDEDEQERMPDGGIRRVAFQVKKRGGDLFQRIRAASTIESGTGS